MTNRFNIDYAHPGFCSLCHEEIAEFEGTRQLKSGVFRPILKRLLGIARTAVIKLDDKSKMTIALCKKCFNSFKPEDMQPLMESEINGWQHEIDDVVDWQNEKKIDYMKKYSKRFATNRVDKIWNKDQRLKIKKPRKSKLKVRTK